MKKIFTILILLFLTSPCCADQYNEKWYVDNYCESKFSGIKEYHFPNGSRVDCMTAEYTLEFGFVAYRYQDIGQTLYYAHKAGKKPGIVFIIRKPADYEAIKDIQPICDKHSIKTWTLSE